MQTGLLRVFFNLMLRGFPILSFALTTWLVSPAPAQDPALQIRPGNLLRSRSPTPSPNLKVDATMILVPVSVSDSLGQPVSDLSSNEFRVFEDNIEQKVASMHKEDGPVSVGFIFDASSSMKQRMERSMNAVQQFLNATRMPGDEFFLIRFSDHPTLTKEFTADGDEILSALSFCSTWRLDSAERRNLSRHARDEARQEFTPRTVGTYGRRR